MPLQTVQATAAVAVVDYDLMQNAVFRIDTRPRRLRRAAYTGSAVIGDTKIRLMIGAREIGQMFNSALLTPQANRDMMDFNEPVPGGMQIYAIVTDAAATSIVYLMLELSPY